MTELHQHPDGIIFIRDLSGDYDAALADFALDNGAPFPDLPPGKVQRIYVPGQRHVVTDARGNDVSEPLAWAPGDEIISRRAVLRAAKAARQPAPPPPIDFSNLDNLERALKAVALTTLQWCNDLKMGTYSGDGPGGRKTIANAKAEFKANFDAIL